MLRVTKETDYGIVILTHFAGQEQGQTITAREVAEEVHLTLPMVSKVLKELVRASLLESHRGVHGGYTLARSADDISVSEMIAAMEGPVGITECTGTAPDECNISEECHVRHNWETINGAIHEALAGIKLSQMAGSLPRPPVTQVAGKTLWEGERQE